MSFILDNFGRTLQKRKESATMILISENYKTGGSKMSGQRYTVNAMGEQCPIPVVIQVQKCSPRKKVTKNFMCSFV